MDKNIKTILQDLYQLDESLKKHEDELIELITVLIKAKPNVSWDENFKDNLRAELLAKFSSPEKEKKSNGNFMNKFIYALGGVGLAMLIIIPLTWQQKETKNIDLALESNINNLPNNAFGSLASLEMQNGVGSSEATMEVSSDDGSATKGFGGGGGAIEMERTVSSIAAPNKMMIAPNPTIYKYKYDGDPFTIDNDQMNVLRKVNNNSSQASLANLINQVNFDIFDISKFSNSKIQNFSLLEDKKFGYQINVNLQNGEIFISQNWEQWPNKGKGNLNIDQVPADDKLFAVTNKFLTEYKINKENYASPITETNWLRVYESSQNKDLIYIPNIMTVIYPQKINDKIVYDNNGSVVGLRLNVDVEEMRVSSVWGLSTQQYESSAYAMETNVDNILKFAEQGGIYPVYEYPEAEIVEISLGTPSLEYTLSWNYDGNQTKQLYVPALVFPIIDNANQEFFYKENVVIPLAKDILNENLDVPMPEPMILR